MCTPMPFTGSKKTLVPICPQCPVVCFVCAVIFPMLKYSKKHTRNLVLLTVFTICCSLGIANYASTTMIPATNHADIHNPAMMRSGHLDQKTDFPHPSENLAVKSRGGWWRCCPQEKARATTTRGGRRTWCTNAWCATRVLPSSPAATPSAASAPASSGHGSVQAEDVDSDVRSIHEPNDTLYIHVPNAWMHVNMMT